MANLNPELSVRIVTFNCGRELIDVDHFAKSLFFPDQDRELPDLLVLCLEEIAPIAQSFLGGSHLTPYTTRFIKAVKQASKQSAYYRVISVPNVGLTTMLFFAKGDITARIKGAETAGVGVGRWEMGNKGAVGIRFGVAFQSHAQPVELTFIAAHLAAGASEVERRNLDWKNIVRGLVFQPLNKERQAVSGEGEEELLLASESQSESTKPPSTVYKGSSAVFIAGDLNYRTSDVEPQKGDVEAFPQPCSDHNDSRHWSKLRLKDQLDRERSARRTLHHLDEAQINFPPTYKYDIARQKLCKEDGSEPDHYHWAPYRWPGWCDRILFSAFLTQKSMIKMSNYTALPIQSTSDHRPVALSFTLDLEALSKNNTVVKAPFDVNENWKSDRASARRKEVVVGTLAYLAFTAEGRALMVAAVVVVGGWLVIRSLTMV